MKNYRIEITKKPKNHPLNVQYTNTRVLTKKDFLKLKREIKNDKENDYSILILSGNTEPLLPSEKIILRIKWLKNILLKNKTINQMQIENIKREYFQKKYFWFYIIITAIITYIITIVLEHYLKK